VVGEGGGEVVSHVAAVVLFVVVAGEGLACLFGRRGCVRFGPNFWQMWLRRKIRVLFFRPKR
jgi:hypothetical protein